MSTHHAIDTAASPGKKLLFQAIRITGSWFLIELAGGVYTNSPALLADAAHMLIFRWYTADPIVSIIVGALILYNSWKLVAESVDILLEAVPRRLDIAAIHHDLIGIDDVVSLHELHVWSIASNTTAMSCHILVTPDADSAGALDHAVLLMREKYGIEHTAIQVEYESSHDAAAEDTCRWKNDTLP